MSILDSQIAPYLTLIAIFAVLLGFFRKILLKVIIILAAEVVLMALFPVLANKLIELILWVRGIL